MPSDPTVIDGPRQHSPSFDMLRPYGWSDRVFALWNEVRDPSLRPARVVRVERGACVVAGDDGVERMTRTPEGVAVGDWVGVTGGTVRAVLPRWSTVARMDPARSGAQAGAQVLAADVDVVVITAPADRLTAARVERELAVAWDSGAVPVVAVTKVDLDHGTDAAGDLEMRLRGVDVLATSARTGEGLTELRSLLSSGRTGLLFGASGAGKSTLANALMGADVQVTETVREDDSRGRHTTTSRQLLCLPSGGVLIDTPGLRSLALAGDVALDEVFPEIDELARACRFRDCRHAGEPGCAVLAAVADGSLDSGRLSSYRKLEREADFERRRLDPLARRAARRLWIQRGQEVRRFDKRRPH